MKRVYKFTFLLSFLAFVSCGVKSSPQPPEDNAPLPVNNLNVKQQGNLLVLYWKYNKEKNTSFKIYINGKTVNLPIFEKGNIFWVEYPFKFFTEYCFEVEVKKGIFSSKSSLRCIKAKNYQPFMSKVDISQGKDKIIVSWNKDVGTFFIYKGNNKDKIPPILYKSVKNKNVFKDTGIAPNKKFCYYITKKENSIESNRIYTSCITYKDIYPPKKPQVSYIKEKNRLIIILGENKETDFAGFLIEKNGKLLTNFSIKSYYFIDKNFKEGDIYKIYSVDNQGNKSEPYILKLQ